MILGFLKLFQKKLLSLVKEKTTLWFWQKILKPIVKFIYRH